MVRGGSVIVSSCLSLGYDAAQWGLSSVLQIIKRVVDSLNIPNNSELKSSNASMITGISAVAMLGASDNYSSNVGKEDSIFEIMNLESLLACILTLIQFSSEALALEENCLQARLLS